MWGYYERSDYLKTDLTLDQIKKIFDNVELDIKMIYYNGNFGDPCINTQVGDITEYFFKRFPKIQNIGVSTNGGMQKPEWWANLGKRFPNGKLIIDFCIDGLEDTNHLYRVGVPYNKAIDNARAFINAGGLANWRWVEFKHNQHQVDIAKKRSADFGFNMFIVNDQGRDDGYVKTGENSFYLIEPADHKNKDFKIPLPEIKNSDHIEYDKFMTSQGLGYYRDKEKSWQEKRTLNCHQHLDREMVYINSVGELYPCCYLGFNPKTYVLSNQNKQLKEILSKFNNNLLEVDWNTAIEWFTVIEEGWKKDSVKNGMVLGCILNCHNKADKVNMMKN